MLSTFYIGPIKIAINSSFDFTGFSVSEKKICDPTYKLTFNLTQSHHLSPSVQWTHRRTHKWGKDENAYYLWCKTRLEPFDESLDFASLWRCTVKKDFSECVVVPPDNGTHSFCETLIFNRILTGFVVNKSMVVYHCCAALINNVGVIFLGKSGAGKSTLAQIISDGNGCILADDRVLLFRTQNNQLFMAGIPQKTDKKSFFSNIVVPVQKVFLLQKNYPIGIYELNPNERYIALAESLFLAPPILNQLTPTKQLLNCYNLFNGLNVYKLGFEKNAKTSIFLNEQIF
jgi:hypothetical protein